MKKRVLVAYASKYGSTREIAEKIHSTLVETGLQADLMEARVVNDLTPYDAVVLGSAAYYWRWLPQAARLLKRNVKILKQKPTWLFSSGPTDTGPVEAQMKGWTFPENLKRAYAAIQPHEHIIFHGVIVPERLKGMMRRIMEKAAEETPFQDYRDWEDIADWARRIAASL